MSSRTPQSRQRARSAQPAPARRRARPAGNPRARRGRLKLGALERRMTWAFALVLVALLAISSRLVWLQGIDHGSYASAAAAQRTQVVALHALRGAIYDRDGVPLAYTDNARDITADPTMISPTNRASYAAQLAPLLGVSALSIIGALQAPGHYAVLARSVSPLAGEQVMKLGLIGVYSQGTTMRQYPGQTTGANIVGMVHANGSGAEGIEYEYDSTLAGKDGSITYPRDGNGNPSPGGNTTLIPPVNGGSVTLTISQDLQFVAQQEVDAAVKASKARSAEVVVLSRTGQVLAMAASGTYNPADPSTIKPNQQLDPPVQQLFEPGSVNKVVTFAAALDKGLITPTSTLEVPGLIHTGGITVHDAWVHPTQLYTATGVLAKSSNVGTLEIANRVGPSTFYDYIRKFGVGQVTGVGLPGEEKGLLPDPSTWSGATFANLPIGQGVAMTALQLAGMYQAVANGGVRIPPRIVASTTASDGAITTTPQPAGVKVMTPQTATTLRTMLESVTQKGGTGVKAAIPGYRVAGKTGTAQQPVNGRYSNSVYWDTFAGMVPADNPQFIISVMVDNPAHGLEGGDVAAPVFHALATYEVQHAKVPPTGSVTAPVPFILP